MFGFINIDDEVAYIDGCKCPECGRPFIFSVSDADKHASQYPGFRRSVAFCQFHNYSATAIFRGDNRFPKNAPSPWWKRTYRITGRADGIDYGLYLGANEKEALQSMLIDADCNDEPAPDAWIVEHVYS